MIFVYENPAVCQNVFFGRRLEGWAGRIPEWKSGQLLGGKVSRLRTKKLPEWEDSRLRQLAFVCAVVRLAASFRLCSGPFDSQLSALL